MKNAITNSTAKARYAMRRALCGEKAIIHLVTDDYSQFVNIMESAYFERTTGESCQDVYSPDRNSRLYIDLDSLTEAEWQEQLLGTHTDDNGKTTPLPGRVLYAMPGRQHELSPHALRCMRDYLARHTLARLNYPHDRQSWPNCCLVLLGSRIELNSFWDQNTLSIRPEPLSTEDFGLLLKPYGILTDQDGGELPDQDEGELVAWYARQLASFPELTIRSILSGIAYGPDPRGQLKNLEAAERVIREEKNSILRQHNKLEYITPKDPGIGLPAVRSWLERHRTNILRTDHTDSEDLTKGFLLVGPPGTGKSMISNAAAAILGLPLLRLNMSSILGQYVSESERNMAMVLEDLRTCGAPCVLQIEEIERALAGAGSDGNGVMDRLIGQLLTFLQELDRPVFVIPTGNDLTTLPDALKRNGRFSSIISVMLPGYSECVEMMHHHLKRHLGSCDRALAAELFDLCTGTEEYPRFLNAADIVEAGNSMCIELGLLPGKGSSQFTWCSDPEGQQAQRDRLKNAMERAAAELRTLINCRQADSLRKIAASYCTTLEMGPISGNSSDALITADRYRSANVTPGQDIRPDGSKMPQCLTAPEHFADCHPYDQRMFRWIGQYMDDYLRRKAK